jgi:uncharacterized membrane protein
MKHEWVLRRNCSLSPRQLAVAYALLCAGALGIALVFVLQGIWFVFGFAVLELAGIAIALLHYARHALDHEHIALTERCLLVERVKAGHSVQVRLDPAWTRISLPDHRRRTLIELESCGIRVEVGRYVSEAARQQVALELKRELRTGSLLAQV